MLTQSFLPVLLVSPQLPSLQAFFTLFYFLSTLPERFRLTHGSQGMRVADATSVQPHPSCVTLVMLLSPSELVFPCL